MFGSTVTAARGAGVSARTMVTQGQAAQHPEEMSGFERSGLLAGRDARVVNAGDGGSQTLPAAFRKLGLEGSDGVAQFGRPSPRPLSERIAIEKGKLSEQVARTAANSFGCELFRHVAMDYSFASCCESARNFIDSPMPDTHSKLEAIYERCPGQPQTLDLEPEKIVEVLLQYELCKSDRRTDNDLKQKNFLSVVGMMSNNRDNHLGVDLMEDSGSYMLNPNYRPESSGGSQSQSMDPGERAIRAFFKGFEPPDTWLAFACLPGKLRGKELLSGTEVVATNKRVKTLKDERSALIHEILACFIREADDVMDSDIEGVRSDILAFDKSAAGFGIRSLIEKLRQDFPEVGLDLDANVEGILEKSREFFGLSGSRSSTPGARDSRETIGPKTTFDALMDAAAKAAVSRRSGETRGSKTNSDALTEAAGDAATTRRSDQSMGKLMPHFSGSLTRPQTKQTLPKQKSIAAEGDDRVTLRGVAQARGHSVDTTNADGTDADSVFDKWKNAKDFKRLSSEYGRSLVKLLVDSMDHSSRKKIFTTDELDQIAQQLKAKQAVLKKHFALLENYIKTNVDVDLCCKLIRFVVQKNPGVGLPCLIELFNKQYQQDVPLDSTPRKFAIAMIAKLKPENTLLSMTPRPAAF